jgi:hypothetical protein
MLLVCQYLSKYACVMQVIETLKNGVLTELPDIAVDVPMVS